MSAKFFVLFLFICLVLPQVFSQESYCTKEELIESLSTSDDLIQAYKLTFSNSHEEAYKILKELKSNSRFTSDTEIENILIFLEAELHHRSKAYLKSVELNESLLLKKSSKDFIFFANMNLGDIYMSGLRNFKKVNKYYKNAELLLDESSCERKKTLVFNALGHSNLLNSNYEEAEKYYNKSLDIYLKNKNYNDSAINYSNLGNLYFEQYKDVKAKTFFLKALNTYKKKDSTNINTRQQINYNLSFVYDALGDYKTSLNYLKKANTLRDSIWNRDKVWEIAEYDKKFEIAEKQKELTILEAENKAKEAQRNAVLISATVLLLLLGVSIYYYIQKVKSNKIISSQNKTLDNLNATKDKLFSIVSHDLRSSVNALKTSNKALISSLQSKNLEKLDGLLASNSSIVNGAYNLLDNLLNWAMLQTKQTYFLIEPHRLHHLAEQVAYNYEALLKEKDITFKNEVSKKAKVLIDKESFKIILRNFLDNAIKFTQQQGAISIHTNLADNYWQIIIEDNGLGMRAEKKAELLSNSQLLSKKENEDVIGTGLGMQLCKSLIKKNNGRLDIESQFGIGTKFIVSLPKVDEDG